MLLTALLAMVDMKKMIKGYLVRTVISKTIILYCCTTVKYIFHFQPLHTGKLGNNKGFYMRLTKVLKRKFVYAFTIT